jgi:hypothetical protein
VTSARERGRVRPREGDNLLQILTTCYILHNIKIEDKEGV